LLSENGVVIDPFCGLKQLVFSIEKSGGILMTFYWKKGEIEKPLALQQRLQNLIKYQIS
jgi:hypothetical protein